MESRDDLKSILAYLPVLVRSTNLFWPSKVVEALKEMAQGPDHSRVNSGEVLFVAIRDMRSSLSLLQPLAPFASEGYALFFDEVKALNIIWACVFFVSSLKSLCLYFGGEVET